MHIATHGDSVDRTVASQHEVLEFDSQLGQSLSVWSLRALPMLT